MSAKTRLVKPDSLVSVAYDEVISWTELYDAVDLAAKKMIIANLINRIEVGTDYQIHIDLNIDIAHFNIELDICTYAQKKQPKT